MARESDFGATLESFFAYDDDVVATLEALNSHFWHLRTALGALWADFGVTWGALATYGLTLEPLWAHFQVTLGSLWGHFGVTWGQFRYLWVTLGQLMVTLQ